ncbi:hypothetical protein JCM10212_003107 [Sporobolomyces blumeae]
MTASNQVVAATQTIASQDDLTTSLSSLLKRQTDLSQAYEGLTDLANQIATKVAGGECSSDDSCAGWINQAMTCLGDGTDQLAMAQCACQNSLVSILNNCVESLSSVCSANLASSSSSSSSSTDSSSSPSATSAIDESGITSASSPTATNLATTTGSATPSSGASTDANDDDDKTSGAVETISNEGLRRSVVGLAAAAIVAAAVGV